MSIVLESLKNQVLGLPQEDRARLLDCIIDSLDDEKSLDRAWDQEAARRDLEVENGTDVCVDGNPDGHFKFPHLWPLKLPRAGLAEL